MSVCRRFYWLKLKRDFFTDKRIKKLRKIAGGDTYTIIYLKMQLLSLQDEGVLYFDNVEETFEEEIALQIDEDVDDVKITIGYLISNGLLKQLSQSEYELVEAKKCIGSETTSAERMRNFRAKNNIESEKGVTLLHNVKKSDVEKEKEKEIEIDNKYNVEDILAYLNQKLKTNYKTTTKATISKIKARVNEGFSLDDFKTVIDKKCDEWIGTDMEIYLRPDTLFGTKFESYLNQKVISKKESAIEKLQREIKEAEEESGL